jgi:hypothetical protein
VDVGDLFRGRERNEGLVVDHELGRHQAREGQLPLGGVDVHDRTGVQDGEVTDEMLPRWDSGLGGYRHHLPPFL